MDRNPEVDTYLSDGCGRCQLVATPKCKVNRWQPELRLLRTLIAECGLNEERKWGMPCYTYMTKNVLVMAAFKEYCTLSFFKGSLLNNETGMLVSPGENSQSTRQLRFISVEEIQNNADVIKSFIFEAIDLEKSGRKVVLKSTEEFDVPEEFRSKLEEFPLLKSAFDALTPGRRRAYLLWFAQPKQSKTREARIEKVIPQILAGKGLND